MDLIDPVTSYVDRGLWAHTSYNYSIRVLQPSGSSEFNIATVTAPHADPFERLYSRTAFINQRIGPSPQLAPDSATIVARSITNYRSSANLTNSDTWGIPIVQSETASHHYEVGCDYYFCDVSFPPVPIPSYAKTSTGSDKHLVVIDPEGDEMDMWAAYKEGDTWRAGTRWMTRADGPAVMCEPGQRCGSANAAGFALAAGVVRPEEIGEGHIDHALILVTPYTRAGFKACPATSTDGRNDDPAALPMGAHVQLDPSIDVNALSIAPWKKVVARALQEYGAYVGDTGGSLSLKAEANIGRGYNAWAKVGLGDESPSIADLPWDRMRVLSMTAC